MEFIKFIFSSGWIFSGFILILLVIFNGIAEVVEAYRREE